MTLGELKQSSKAFLTPSDIAPILGSDQHTIRVSARTHPETVRFPFTIIGNRMKIPRLGFLRWLEGGETPNADE